MNIDFEDHFSKENISMDKIEFARHYIETHIGADIDEDPIIEISPIGGVVFGYMVLISLMNMKCIKKVRWMDSIFDPGNRTTLIALPIYIGTKFSLHGQMI